jgi:CBS domain containing-hemolysin-like protein
MEPGNFLTIILNILLVIFLVMLNGFFVAAEFALVKIRQTQLLPLARKGNRRAKAAQRILRNIDAYISATQLGITLAGLGLGALAVPVFEALLQPLFAGLGVESLRLKNTIALIVGFLINTFLLIVMGELVPKSLAIRKTLETTLWVAYPLIWFYKLTFPFIWVLNSTAQWILQRWGVARPTEGESAHSEEELRLLFDATQSKSGCSSLSRDIVLNALDLRHRKIREIMRPRKEITSLSTTASMMECLAIAEKTRFSRFPLCEDGNLDKTLATVHIKDLYAMRLKAKTGADLIVSGRKIIYVPQTARLVKLMQMFFEKKVHLAIVVDEFGGTLGMVTLENVLEELVGQIQDEFDQEKPLLEVVGDHVWLVDGALPLRELSELVGETIAEEGIATTSGLVTRRMGGFPKASDVLTLGAFELRVDTMDGPTVAKLKLTRTSPPATTDSVESP